MKRLAPALLLALALAACAHTHASSSAMRSIPDPRVGLATGWMNAGQAIRNLTLVSHTDRPANFVNPAKPGDFGFANSDLAFQGNFVFQGNYNGFQVWDISNPAHPVLRTSLVCTGGQGDVSVYKNLLFVSVEETRGRLDCGTQGVADTVSADRFRGVRIFDISDIDHPRQVADVQTCRGSHTHTIFTSLNDPANLYVYVQGTGRVRPGAELTGCSGRPAAEDPNTSLFRIEVIRVPLASPQDAKIVSMPRVFADSAGNIAGLWKGGAHGEGTQTTSETSRCHDITVYPELGLAAGACSGNGILLDIHDPVNPKRIGDVSDPNFAFWHSATFNNDGTKLLFTDEWGGGTQPRCLATDNPKWGADAIFSLSNGKLTPAGYYKLPAPQTDKENCVAHNGSLIPVPGRDIMVQAWYQGGVSVFDFTDPAKVQEIAFFDRGPVDTTLTLGGYWSAYWWNGRIIGSEIARGLDIFELTPSAYLTQNEIDAAKLVTFDTWNPQDQQRITWPARFVVARAYVDGMVRRDASRRDWGAGVMRDLAAAEKATGSARQAALDALATRVAGDASGVDAARIRALSETIRNIGMGA